MGEVIRFVSRGERERARLIRESRAIYDRIFPPADPVRERQDRGPDAVSRADTYRSEGDLSS